MKILLFLVWVAEVWSFGNCSLDVERQFNNISTHGRDIPIKVSAKIFLKFSYTKRMLNKLGLDNHFQGIQKLEGKDNFVVTGSDINHRHGDMFIIRDARFRERIVLDKWPYWHPGGIQIYENILAVPVEEYKKSEISKIYFFDLEAESVQKLPVSLDIPTTKSGAVFFTRLTSGIFLLGSFNMSRLDFYYSKSSDLLDGFESLPRFSLEKRNFFLGKGKPLNISAQSINILPQCDGKYFLVFFENTGKIISKENRARLFKIDLGSQEVFHVSSKIFVCGKKCNFNAAAGTYIDNNGKIFIYSSPHWLSFNQRSYNIREFSESPLQ